jgi:hypothetical protein
MTLSPGSWSISNAMIFILSSFQEGAMKKKKWFTEAQTAFVFGKRRAAPR